MARQLRVEVVGDTSSYQRALAAAGKSTASFSRGFAGSAGQWAKGAVVFEAVSGAIHLAGAAIGAGVREWKEQQKVAAQTGAVLKSTGGAANVTAKQIGALAQAISRKSGVDDEAIQSGENLLLTFTGIRNQVGKGNDVFNQATQAITDMSVSLGQDMKSSAIQVGKALNDPIKGVTALQRVGVSFTEAQKKQIKALVDSGKTMEAQKLILRELNKEFGGSAEAAGKTLPGQLSKLKNSFDELSGRLVAKLVPALMSIVTWVNAHWPEISKVMDVVGTAVVKAIDGIATAVRAIIPVVQAIVAWFQQNWPEISRITLEVFNKIAPVVVSTFNTVRAVIEGAVTVIQAIWARFGDLITKTVVTAFEFISNTIKNAMEVIRGIVNVVGGLLHGDWSRVWLGLQQIFGGIWAQIQNMVKTALEGLRILFEAAFRALSIVVTNALNGIVTLFKGLGNLILGALGNLGNLLVSTGSSLVQGLKDGIDRGMGAVLGWARSLGSAIFNAIGHIGDLLSGVGWAIINGLWNGMKRAWEKVTGWLSSLGGKITSLKGPPAKDAVLLEAIGRLIIGGLGKGMQKEWAVVQKWLGTLGVAIVKTFAKTGTDIGGPLIKGLSPVGQMIVTAAKKWGIDARAALAVAMTEGGLKFGAVGDNGTSFGPFQLHIGGENPYGDPKQAAAFANSIQGINFALRRMAEEGAKGKVGLEAIKAIVGGPGWGFERPANAAAEVAKAFGYFQKIPGQLQAAKGQIQTASTSVITSVINATALYVQRYGSVIGVANAKAIALGIVQGKPEVVAATIKTIRESAAAAAQTAAQAWSDLAQKALNAFDAKVSAWQNPLTKKLTQAANKEEIQSAAAGIGQAITDVLGGTALDAENTGNDIGTKLATAMAEATSNIMNSKMTGNLQRDTANLARVAAEQAAAISKQITDAAQPAIDKANADVAAAQAALAAAAPGSDAATEAQTQLNEAVARRQALETAVQGVITTATTQLATAVDTQHATIAAHDRTGLENQLTQTGTYLAKHPELWNKMGIEVGKVVASFGGKLEKAGIDWVTKFGDGIKGRTDYAVSQARALGAAVKSALDEALKGSPEYFTYYAGQEFVNAFGRGMAKAKTPTFMPRFSPAELSGAGGMTSVGGGLTVNVTVEGSVTSERDLHESIYRELTRRVGRNPSIGLGSNPLTA